MRRHSVGRTLALLAGAVCLVCLEFSCAADPGDPLKAPNGAVSGSGSSGTSSGGGSGSGSGASSGGNGSGLSSGSTSGSSSGSGSSGGGGSGFDSGSTGDGGPVDAGPIVPEGGASCTTPTCPLKVQYKSTNTAANTIGPNLNILNAGSAPVDLANVKVHYYFTADGDTSLQFECDYAGYYNSGMTGFDKSKVIAVFVPMGATATPTADTYLELSFTSASLPAGTAVSVNFRVHNSSYAVTYNQLNDWSFNGASAATYVDALTITAYLNGVLAWGTEPALVPDAGAPSGDAGDGG